MTKRMADAIYPANLPPGMDAYLGYVDGRWPDYVAIARAHGDVPCYGLTVFGNPNIGQGSDAEPGDATIAQQAQATRGELARFVDRPIAYCPESWAASVVGAHAAVGLFQPVFRLLTAHYGQGPHICAPETCGCAVRADGTQWIDHGPWDESLLADSFLHASDHPGPPTTTSQEAPMIVLNPGEQCAVPLPAPTSRVYLSTDAAGMPGQGNCGARVVIGKPGDWHGIGAAGSFDAGIENGTAWELTPGVLVPGAEIVSVLVHPDQSSKLTVTLIP